MIDKSLPKKQLTLSRQLLTRLAIALSAVGFITLWINYRLIKANLEEKVEKRAHSITEGVKFATEDLIKSGQITTLQRVVQNASSLPQVIEVTIVSPEGLTIASSVDSTINLPYRPKFSSLIKESASVGAEVNYRIKIDNRSVLVDILPFKSNVLNTEQYGLVVVVLDLEEMEKQATRILLASSLTFFLGIVCVLAIVGVLLDRKIFRPLIILHRAIIESQQNSRFILPNSVPDNEIGFLAHAFADTIEQRNQIAENLESQLNKITFLEKITQKIRQRRFRKVAFLEQITQKIRQSLDIEIILDLAARQIGNIFGISYCHIYLYSTKSLPHIPLMAEYVDRDNPASQIFLKSLEGNLYLQELLKDDRAIGFRNVSEESLLEDRQDWYRELNIKSVLGVRTSYQDKPNGIIVLGQCKHYHEWTQEEIELLEAVATRVGIAIAQARLIEQEKEQKIQLDRQNKILQQEITERKQVQKTLKIQHLKFQLFSEIALKIRQSLDLQDILQTTVTEVQKILLAERILIYRVEKDGSGCVIQEKVLAPWSSMLNLHFEEEVFPSIKQKLYKQNKVVAIDCTKTAYAEKLPCMFAFAQKWSIKAKLVAAIWHEQNLWGFLIAHQCSTTRNWKDFERKLVQQLADQVGIAITHAQILAKEKELTNLKSSFISMASHEFRTPLAIIGSSAELLQHYGEKLNETKKLKHFGQIQSSIQHMTELLEDVLMINKVEAEKVEFNPVTVDLIKFCGDLVEKIQQSAPEYQVLMAIHGIDDSPQPQSLTAEIDPKLLRQILTNLLTNAMKYSSEGSKIYFDLTYDADCFRFRITDEGIGIPPEDIKKIFTPFHRANNVGNISGTGLGLAIVQKCVQLHQGTIDITSEVGVGTTFTVTIFAEVSS